MRWSFLTVTLIALALTQNGCALTPKPHLEYQSGVAIETLSANASISSSKGEHGMGGSGYLLYQRPDRLRLVILSPFGSTLMDTIVADGRITIIYSSQKAAFSGQLDELPRMGEGETWRHASWVMDLDPPGGSIREGVATRINSMGDTEQVTFENGLVVSKSLTNGDLVRYQDFLLVNGVPLATEIIMDSHDGGRFRIKLTDPEVNTRLSADAFSARLDGLALYPVSALRVR